MQSQRNKTRKSGFYFVTDFYIIADIYGTDISSLSHWHHSPKVAAAFFTMLRPLFHISDYFEVSYPQTEQFIHYSVSFSSELSTDSVSDTSSVISAASAPSVSLASVWASADSSSSFISSRTFAILATTEPSSS